MLMIFALKFDQLEGCIKKKKSQLRRVLISFSFSYLDQLANLHSDTLRDLAPLP